ncbi:MAG: VanZ family protein [Lachnospiraceae bacterium]|nr:VanZ family protein [Lachnospiraceae bacterium]
MRLKVIIIIIIVSIAAVWWQSSLSADRSREESGAVLGILQPFHGTEMPEDLTDLESQSAEFINISNIFRKFAHFIEYAVLGFEFGLLVIFVGKKRKTRLRDIYRFAANTVFAGILTALLDETIQIFSGRGPEVKDVWIDTTGFLTGEAVVFIIYYIWKKFVSHRNS